MNATTVVEPAAVAIATPPAHVEPRVPPASRHDAATLAAGYTRTQHALNVAGLAAFCALAAWVGWQVFSRSLAPWQLLAGFVAGWVLTDFICGLIHWAGDTWGRPGMPVIGRMFVRTFREHHVDPAAITRHGVVQVLGEQALVAAPLMALLGFYDPADDDLAGTTVLVGAYVLLAACMAANLFHQWAHRRNPPALGRLLQALGLVISFRQHARHHCPPYTQSYCIAIGWLNPVLDRIRFWRALEWLVYKTTGA
ncbi:MAG: hypothetical protein KJ044_15470, partial [Planctomycetes bacterium]|nr:hypothetical protein [Planctomycetota bacterium]